jgi:hypothetical protein
MTNPNSSSPEERAAGYALDILDDWDEFEQELADSEILQAELADFQSSVSDLAYAVPMVPLPAGLKGKLFDRLDLVDSRPTDLLELMDRSIADLQQVARDLPHWQPFPQPQGSEYVVWHTDLDRAQKAFFLRVPIPGTLPRHWHATGESILVLEGNFIDDDGTEYGVGDRFYAAADTSHEPITSMGCLILSVTSTRDKALAR